MLASWGAGDQKLLTMSDQFDGNLGASFAPDPNVDLKSQGLPWPVYLAIGLAVVAGIGFLGVRIWQGQKNRKLHAEFMQRFADYEKDEVGGFWKCLFGKEGDGRRFTLPEQFAGQLDASLMVNAKDYPETVREQCVPKLTRAASRMKDLSPPLEYTDVLERYNKALSGMANALAAWAENAPKRYKSRNEQKQIEDAGTAWSQVANPRKPEPAALTYEKYLQCAVPGVDKMKDADELLGFLASHCLVNAPKGWKVDKEFLSKVRETCIPEAASAQGLKPSSSFAAVQSKMAPEYERVSQAMDKCFKEAFRGARQDDAAGLGKTWLEYFNANSEVRKVGSTFLKND